MDGVHNKLSEDKINYMNTLVKYIICITLVEYITFLIDILKRLPHSLVFKWILRIYILSTS